MRKVNFKIVLLYLLVTIYIAMGIFIQIYNLTPFYTRIINPICWLLISFYSLYILSTITIRSKDKLNKTQTVLIIVMIYLIIYYLLGLFFGYANSPYSHKFRMILINCWSYISIILFQEITRNAMVPGSKLKFFWYFYTTILFTLCEISFYRFTSNFVDAKTIFEYSCSVLLPALARNILFTYLASIGGLLCIISYRIPIMFTNLLVPIFPDLEWFWISLLELLLVIIIFIQINYMHERKMSRFSSRKSVKKDKLITKIPLLSVTVLFVSFVAGIFKYMPVAIMSNSMADLIKRGDVVVIKKLSLEDKKDLNVNDIIVYGLDGSQVVHRIIKIEKKNENEYSITTKGDNNKNADLKKVTFEQISGKVLINVPKIGYPAVLLNEFFESNSPNVEKGK